MRVNETSKKWLQALVVCLVLAFALSLYLYLRRGYYNVYIINKVLGSTAAILAGFTLIAGPLRRILLASPLMKIRRHLGIMAFGIAILHIVFSLYQSDRFTWFSWYVHEWIPVIFGLTAITLWGYMTYISRNGKIVEMGADVWKNRLSLLGKIAFVAVFLHVTVMKYEGWLKWVSGQVNQTPELANPQIPPASLFIFIFMLAVIILRIFAFLKKRDKLHSTTGGQNTVL